MKKFTLSDKRDIFVVEALSALVLLGLFIFFFVYLIIVIHSDKDYSQQFLYINWGMLALISILIVNLLRGNFSKEKLVELENKKEIKPTSEIKIEVKSPYRIKLINGPAYNDFIIDKIYYKEKDISDKLKTTELNQDIYNKIITDKVVFKYYYKKQSYLLFETDDKSEKEIKVDIYIENELPEKMLISLGFKESKEELIAKEKMKELEELYAYPDLNQENQIITVKKNSN